MEIGIGDKTLNFINFFRDVDALKFIKSNGMRWAGHIMRLERNRSALRVFNTVPFGQRPRGRPKRR